MSNELRELLKPQIGKRLVCELRSGRSFNSVLIEVGKEYAIFETNDGRKMINRIRDLDVVCEVDTNEY